MKLVKEKIGSKDPEEVEELTRKARLTLLRNQRYALEAADLYEDCGLRVVKEASLEFIDFEERKPRSFVPSFTEKGELSLSFAFFDEDEVGGNVPKKSTQSILTHLYPKGYTKHTMN